MPAEKQHDKWRFRCPEGHASWRSDRLSDAYWCEHCDSEFKKLVDWKHKNKTT